MDYKDKYERLVDTINRLIDSRNELIEQYSSEDKDFNKNEIKNLERQIKLLNDVLNYSK